MSSDTLRLSLRQIGVALRDPEEFAARWHRGEANYRLAIWIALAVTAAVGTACYGMTMGLGQGASAVVQKAALLTLAAGLAWAIPLPALYILNSMLGSQLKLTTTLLAALVTTSWGGLAMLASVPINWFFTTAVPELPALDPIWVRHIILGINMLVFAGVGASMVDVFGRVMCRLEPSSGRWPTWYLGLVFLIGMQLYHLFGLFAF
jgi:hypothetical protein